MAENKNSVAGIAIQGSRIFIARRTAGGDLGGKWEFPGGKVEINESADTALKREYLEEFELPVKVGAQICSSVFEHHGVVFNLSAYRIYFDSAFKNIRLKEHTEWKWALLTEIRTLDFADSDRGLLQALELYISQDGCVE